MIKEIIDVLHSNFPDVRIYTETIEQGLKEPCFLISHLSASGKSEITNRMKVTNQFMIQYFPIPYKITGKHTENEQCTTMLSAIIPLLADLKSYHANVLNGTIRDGVLNFECAYPEINVNVVDSDVMVDYDMKFKEKGE